MGTGASQFRPARRASMNPLRRSSGSRAVDGARYAGSEEPTLNELLNDPIMQRLLDSDGIAPESLRAVLDDARARLMP